MKTKTGKTLIPRLHFPEFQNKGEWEVKRIGEFLTKYKARVKDSINNQNVEVVSVGELGLRKRNEVYSKILSVNIENNLLFPYGSICFGLGSKKMALAVNKFENSKYCVSPAYNIYKIDTNRLNIIFYDYLINYYKNLFDDAFLVVSSRQGKKIDFNRFFEQPILIPSLPEQQKIASCLSSLDEVIAGERQWLELLKAHKKGLLQNLFPQEGETLPKLRFPEFQDTGEWVEKRVGEIGNVIASGDLDIETFSSIRTEKYKYPVYSNSISNEGLYGFSSTFKFKRNSMTVTARGTIGVAFERKSDFTGIGRLIVVTDLKDVCLTFLKENWNHQAKINFENGGIPQLTAIKAKLVTLLFPKSIEEQQKIASCLSSLDNVIQAQQQKIEWLEQHKKGLLQGLFPNVNDGDNG